MIVPNFLYIQQKQCIACFEPERLYAAAALAYEQTRQDGANRPAGHGGVAERLKAAVC